MLKSLEIKKSGLERLLADSGELLRSDVEGTIKSLTPGEWVLLRDPTKKRIYLAFANPLIEERFPAIQVVGRLQAPPTHTLVEDFIKTKIQNAWNHRLLFAGYSEGCRAFYGQADGLPGLIIDVYAECTLIQINTAGLDKHRAFVKTCAEEIFKKPCYFLDNPAQRSKEVLPHHRETIPIEKLSITEDNFKYEVPVKNLQKIGWYYDHRENRRKFGAALQRWTGSKESGLDLFCYGGAWGMHALKGGVKHVDFVDQAPLGEMIDRHLELNKFSGSGKFQRSDVFDWLDQQLKAQAKYDVIVSDPPAFAKSPKEKSSAIEGYRKLHKKVLKLASPTALIAFASCTHYVTQDEFIDTIVLAARSEGRRISILETGMQGWDHPVEHMESKANYIKYTLVSVE
jgi:23S rRNA (cytosine1962-C5)-methyltransferase